MRPSQSSRLLLTFIALLLLAVLTVLGALWLRANAAADAERYARGWADAVAAMVAEGFSLEHTDAALGQAAATPEIRSVRVYGANGRLRMSRHAAAKSGPSRARAQAERAAVAVDLVGRDGAHLGHVEVDVAGAAGMPGSRALGALWLATLALLVLTLAVGAWRSRRRPDISTTEAGRVEPSPRWSDPEEIVKGVVAPLAAHAHACGLALTVFVDPAVPQQVCTDPGLVRQILLSLVGDAIDATHAGGVQLSLQRDRDAQMLCIHVSMAPGVQPASLAEPKAAAGPDGCPHEGGTGVELAIGRRLARLLGGDIRLARARGAGSCFTLTLPLPASVPDGQRAAAAAPLTHSRVAAWADDALLADALGPEARACPVAPESDPSARLARRAAGALPVLLAEDSRPNQLVATAMLTKAGFRVDVVENGLQAVAAVKRRDYALVLMDLAMPDMDGLEATGGIRALPGPRGRVPIVAMTANALDEDRRRCLEAGMDGYLSKPIDRRLLFEALLEWVDAGATAQVPAVAADARVPGAVPVPEGIPAPGPWAAPASDPEPAANAAFAPAREPAPARPAAADAPQQAMAVSATGDAPPVLDETVAAALVRDLGDALMPEVVGTFVIEVRERVSAIEQAAAAGDSARAGKQGHALKGSAATFGAVALHQRALAIERAGRVGGIEAVRAQAGGLAACAEAVIELLQGRWGGAA